MTYLGGSNDEYLEAGKKILLILLCTHFFKILTFWRQHFQYNHIDGYI